MTIPNLFVPTRLPTSKPVKYDYSSGAGNPATMGPSLPPAKASASSPSTDDELLEERRQFLEWLGNFLFLKSGKKMTLKHAQMIIQRHYVDLYANLKNLDNVNKVFRRNLDDELKMLNASSR